MMNLSKKLKMIVGSVAKILTFFSVDAYLNKVRYTYKVKVIF